MPAARVSHLSPKDNENGVPADLQSVSENGDEKTPYEMVLYNLHHDPKWVKEVSLGRRVGFYRFRGELGHGNFSTVKLAHHQLTKDKVAVKVIEKGKLDQKTQRMLAREISNMDVIAHSNIIRLFEVVETLSRIYLVLEFAPGGELFNRVSTEGKLSEDVAMPIFAQVLSAIIYLHNLSIIHRDIKAENVFMVTSRKAKLGDFGFSTKVSQLKDQLSTFCGSPPYAAPELYKDESYEGPAVDAWALGVLLFFILTADMPFKASTVSGLKRQILGGSFFIPIFVSCEARDLINHLMMQSPKDRLRPHEISSHSWFKGTENVQQEPLPKYMNCPRRQDCMEEITKEERNAFKHLQEWGLSRRSLAQSSEQGARSSLVATYRILLHRILHAEELRICQAEIHLRAEAQLGFNHSEKPSPKVTRKMFMTRKHRMRLRKEVNKSTPKKSKSCVIL